MALPGGRKLVVDGKDYEWICKEKRASYDVVDDYGNEEPAYEKMITIRADTDGGKLVQHRINRSSITPELVAELVKDYVKVGKL